MNKISFGRMSYVLAIMLIYAAEPVLAQDSSFSVSLASPNAASLGKYGDIPIGYNTGTPNIDIPIYTVKAGKLSLPISLSYHASGLKVQEQASWVGAGWALNAGGVITRTVIGEPDDRGNASVDNVTNGYYSDYGYFNYLFIPGSGPGQTSDGMVADDIDFARGYRDGEPDLYFFNFAGYTGKFYFNDDRTPIFVPEQDFKVRTDFTLGPGFTGFVITTPDGVSYYFGNSGNTGSVSPIEISNPSTVQSGPDNAKLSTSSWYLNKIVSADGTDSIKLTYAQENYSDYTLTFFPVPFTDGIISPAYLTSGGIQGYNIVKNFITGVRLAQITFPNGTVTFTPSATPRTDLTAAYSMNDGMYDAANTYSVNNPYPAYSLGSVQITNNNGFCKKDSLYFGYFFDNTPLNSNLLDLANAANIQSDAYRLRLDSVQETSCDATAKVPPYKFNYFSEPVLRKLSFGLDHWGFSNGMTGNPVLIPTLTLQNGANIEYVTGANRDAAWPAMRGGALQQITYPTGGFTSFAYGPNDTYENYTKDTLEPSITLAAGWTESTLTETQTITLDGDIYQFYVDNSRGVGTAVLQIRDAGGGVLEDISATAGQISAISYFQLPPGNYTSVFSFTPASNWTSGEGAEAYFGDWYPEPVSGNVMVGGLRIDTLTNNDGVSANDNMVTTYNYTSGGQQSSGILYSRPIYVNTFRNDLQATIFGYCDGSPSGCVIGSGSQNYISPGSIFPMATVQGNHIGYNQVTVSQPGNGSHLYMFYGSNIWDNNYSDVCTRYLDQGCSPSLPNYPAAPLPFDYMRGELEYEAEINASGQYLHDAWHFPMYEQDSVITPGFIAILSPYFTGTTYNLQSAYKVKDSVVQTDYDNTTGSYLTSMTSTSYNSKFHHQQTRKIATTSTGDSLATNFMYTADLAVPACTSLVDSLSYYLSIVHNDSISFSSLIYSCTPQACTTDNCVFVNYQQFRRNLALARIAYVNRRLAYLSTYATNHTTAENSADTALKPILRMQDEYTILPIEVSQWRDNRLIHSTFDKYDTSLNPVGFVYPDRTQLINLQAASGTFTPAAVSGNTITKDSRYLDETLFQFATGNPQQVTPYSGITNAYIWDYQNQQPIAKATNAPVSQIAYTSFEANGSGSWTIGSSARDTGSITGAQCYNLNNGACSRSGLTSTNSYVVSYWTKTGSSYTVSGNTAVVQGKTIGGWTYFEHTVSGVSTLTVSGAGDIDELRLYPTTAQMTTYTYTPLVGMTSQCDADNRVTYYQYDALGRMKVVLDQDHNVIKTVQYHYQGQ